MGIGSWLLGLGVRAENTAASVGVRTGAIPLQWPARGSAPSDGTAGVVGEGSLIYRLPREPEKRASIFSKSQTIIVNEGETAVVLEDGRSSGALEPGRYTFEKARIVGSLDIVWLKTGQQTVKWGIGNVLSVDGIQVSGRGILFLRVANPVTFNAEVVQGAITLSEVDLQRFLMPRVQGVLRQVVASLPARALMMERDAFFLSIRNNLGPQVEHMGLQIVDLEVVEVNLPPEYKAAIAQHAMVAATEQARLLEAQTAARVSQIEASAAAQARLATGMADVQLLATLQAQGIDPLKLKALEALQAMAENPSQGGLLGGDTARAVLFGQVATAALNNPSAPPVIPAAPMTPPPQITEAPPPPRDPMVAPGAGDTAAKIASVEEQIDKLVERLALGEISEDTYNKLVARLEARLAQLRGA
jgi:regulator of protease activity HflC (stomatin/prohibitin superfamily)